MAQALNIKNKAAGPKVAVQPKLEINSPGDSYEQEADAMAEKVMRISSAGSPPSERGAATVAPGMIGRSVQRKCAHCEEEEKKKPVMRKSESGAGNGRAVAGIGGAGFGSSMLGAKKMVQRKCAHCEEEEKRKSLMRKNENGSGNGGAGAVKGSTGGSEASASLRSVLNRSAGGGIPLPSGTKSFMENAFSKDFSRVRVHTGNESSQMNMSIGAKAFTYGSDIFFNEGQFSPESMEGKKLLAHELTHVVQQNNFIARKGAEGAPDKIPLPGTFFVAKKGQTYVYTFNSEDIRSWEKPEFKVFSYYARDVFNADESVAQKFIDYLNDETQEKPNKWRRVKLNFFSIDPKEMANKYPAITIPILLELHQIFTQWLKDNDLGDPQKVQIGFRDLEQGDEGDGKDAKNGKPGKAGPRGKNQQNDNRKTFTERPPEVILQMGKYYAFLLGNFSQHSVFTNYTATLNDLITFAGNRPAAYNALPALPQNNVAPTDPSPWQLFLDAWNAFIQAFLNAAKGRSDGNKETTGVKREGEKDGSKDGIHKFDASATLKILDEQPKYVKGSHIAFRVMFDHSSNDNYYMNFPPFKDRAVFDWTIKKQIAGLAPVDYDSGPLFETGARDYDLDLNKVGTYSVGVVISSPQFRNNHVYVSLDNIIVINEAARADEVFEALLATGADTPFERGEDGKLKLKPGQEPFSIGFELGLVESERKHVDVLVKEGKLSKEQADEYKKYLDERDAALNKVKGEEDNNKDYKRYIAEGTFLSRENSQSIRLQSIMFRKARKKTGIHLIYELDFLDTTLDPSSPAHHPGESDISYYNNKEEDKEWVRAERNAVNNMADHFHSHNDYPNGTVRLALVRLEDGQVMQLPAIDTHNAGKTIRAGLGYLGIGLGLVALAATPFTAGTTAPVGIVIIQASAIAIGVANVLLEVYERYQKEREIKADRRLLVDIVSLVGAVMGAGGFTNALRTASQAGKLLYISSMIGLDIGSGVILTISTRDEIHRVEALYAVRIANETDAGKKRELEIERDNSIARILGAAALNGAFIIASTAIGAHQVISGVGSKSGNKYSIRQEISDLSKSAKSQPDAVRARLEEGNLTPDEHSFLQESLLAPKDEVPVSEGEVREQKIGKLGAMNDDTRKVLREPEKQPLLDALAENPLAADALKLCHSLCIPEFATPAQVKRLEAFLAGKKVNRALLKEYLHSKEDVVSLGEAIDKLIDTYAAIKEGHLRADSEGLIDERELLELFGVQQQKPADIRFAEAKAGNKFDDDLGKNYPHNEVPIRDNLKKLRRLDSWDPVKGEIVSRKSLASTGGQIASIDPLTMQEYFMEFKLKYPDGATIADVPSTRAQLLNGKPLAGQKINGKFILEVPEQTSPISDKVLADANSRNVTIRDTNGKVYNSGHP